MSDDLRKDAFEVRSARRRLLRLSALLIGVIAIVLIILVQMYGLRSVQEHWDSIQPMVITVKWGGFAVLIWQWNAVIDWLAQRQNMSDGYRKYLLSMRWRVAGALLLLELLLGWNILGRILS